MLELLSARDVRSFVYTNGYLFHRFQSEELLQWNLNAIVVSVDGVDPASYERLRSGGKYRPLREGVVHFFSRRNRTARRLPEVEIRHVIMPGETPKQLLEFRKD